MPHYAEQTTVSKERSINEIERIVERHGATGFVYGWEKERAAISFQMNNRRIRFIIPMPNRSEYEHTPTGRPRGERAQRELYEQATRQRWRALLLMVKAKLEAVTTGIATFDEEFLAYVQLPGGKTVGETIIPQIDVAYQTGKLLPLLPSPHDE